MDWASVYTLKRKQNLFNTKSQFVWKLMTEMHTLKSENLQSFFVNTVRCFWEGDKLHTHSMLFDEFWTFIRPAENGGSVAFVATVLILLLLKSSEKSLSFLEFSITSTQREYGACILWSYILHNNLYLERKKY